MIYEKTKLFACKMNENDMKIINQWCYKNNLSMAYAVRRGLKDFIKNYVDTNTMPPTESINPGCIIKV